MKHLRSLVRWVARWAARSVWWPLAAKAFAAVLAFLALAHVGSGAAAHLTVPAAPGSSAAAERSAAAPVASSPPSSTASAATSCDRKPAPTAWTDDGKLILNRAAASDLEKLPRIGQKRAEAIVSLRQKLGRFKHVRDLMRIRGIGYRLVQKLTPLVVVDAPSS